MEYETDYGTITIGTKYAPGDNNTYPIRYDRYVSKRDGEISTDRIHCVGRTDDTKQYDGKQAVGCPCCWLGYGHTIRRHNQRAI